MSTLCQPANMWCYKSDPQRAAQWQKTLTTVTEAGTWLIKHEESITAFTTSKARGSNAASSSSAPPIVKTSAMAPMTGAPAAALLGGTPPWRQHEPSQPLPKARPVAHAAVPPPPPPSRRSALRPEPEQPSDSLLAASLKANEEKTEKRKESCLVTQKPKDGFSRYLDKVDPDGRIWKKLLDIMQMEPRHVRNHAWQALLSERHPHEKTVEFLQKCKRSGVLNVD